MNRHRDELDAPVYAGEVLVWSEMSALLAREIPVWRGTRDYQVIDGKIMGMPNNIRITGGSFSVRSSYTTMRQLGPLRGGCCLRRRQRG